MGLLQSRLTARRFRVIGDLPDDFRDMFRERLTEFAFMEPPVTQQEVHGWTLVDDVTETNFADFNTWYIDHWMIFALRVDKRVLPAQVFKATVNKKCREWAEERNIKRCPASVRSEIKDQLEQEWLRRVMPRTQHTQLSWNVDTGVVYVSSHSDLVCDTIRKRFFRTFGLKMVPFSPLEWIKSEPVMVSDMLAASPSSINTIVEETLTEMLSVAIINAERDKNRITVTVERPKDGEE